MFFLKQKAKAAWLKEEDDNSTLFHQSIRQRIVKTSVYGIYNTAGKWLDSCDQVKNAFLEYYKLLWEKLMLISL